MDVYIISYFGRGPDAQLRHSFHYQQLCVMLNTPGVEDIHILAMDYKDIASRGTRPPYSLYMPHPRIHYHESELVPPGEARNKLLKLFNSTQKPWALFADNDAYIDIRFQGADIVQQIDNWADTLAEYCDVLSPIYGGHTPFNKKIADLGDSVDTHIGFVSNNYLKTTLFFAKNKTYYGEDPIYFDEQLTEMEDFEYQGRLLAHGRGIYQFKAVVMMDLGTHTSTLFPDNNRKAKWDTIKEDIFNRYKDYGAVKVDGNINWSKIRCKYSKPRHLWLPYDGNRQEIYTTAVINRNQFNTLFEFANQEAFQ